MTTGAEHLTTTLQDGVLTLTLTRPEKKNALTSAMYQGMADALADANENDAVRAVVLTGGEGVFTAGNDLKDFAAAAKGRGPSAAQAFLRNLIMLDKPIVAAVDGVAIGVGTTMLLHCDYVVAGPTASFATPFVDLALCPEGASSLLMPARLGRAATFRLLMLGDRLNAEDAHACGLADQLADKPLAAAAELAARLAAKPAGAMRATKRLIAESAREDVIAQLEREFAAFEKRLVSAEAQAAFQAFLNR